MDGNLFELNPRGTSEPLYIDAGVKLYDNESFPDGLRPEDFLQNAERNGWPNASRDDMVRAFAVLYNPEYENMPKILGILNNGSEEENKEEEREALRQFLIRYVDRKVAEGFQFSPLQEYAVEWVNNQRTKDIACDPEKMISDLKGSAFLDAAEEKGWANATNDPILHAFVTVYNPEIGGFSEAADKIKNGTFENDEARTDFRNHLLASLIGHLQSMEERSGIEQNLLETLINYNEALLDKKVPPVRPRQENVNEEENVNEAENGNEVNQINEENPVNNAENVNVAEDPNLIPINHPERMVKGSDWTAFHQKLAANGWADAEKDNTVRALFNLSCTEGQNEALESLCENLLRDREQPSPTLKEDFEVAIRNVVRDRILEKAKRKEPFAFDEEQRKSVLHFQEMLNTAVNEQHYDYNFNADHPAPVPQVENVIENNEQRPEEVHEDHQEVHQEVQPEEVLPEVEHKRPVMDNVVMKSRARQAKDFMEDYTLKFRGGKDYDYARDAFIRVQEKWQAAMEAGNGRIPEDQLLTLKGELKNVLFLQDKYLGRKMKEKDKSSNGTNRVFAQSMAFDLVEEQLYALDIREEQLKNATPPNLEQTKNASAAAMQAINDAKLFMRGSEQYKIATESFEKMNRRFEELHKKYQGKENQITTAELDELRMLVDRTDDKVSDYTTMKYGETVGENTIKRTEAMGKARTVLEGARRKIDTLLKAKETEPLKTIEDLKREGSRDYLDILEAERDVHFGSSEYKNAKNDFQAYTDKLAALDNDDTADVRQLDDLGKQMDKTVASIDKYLATKAGEELGEKTQKRVDAMRQAKENILQAKKKHAELVNERRKPLAQLPEETLQTNESKSLSNLTATQTSVDGSKVWFGGKDYDKALELYGKAVSHEVARDQARKENQPSKNSLEAELTELKEAKEAALIYIERKETQRKEKNGLDNKGEKRLANMTAAYNDLNVRIDRCEAKLDTIRAAEKAEQDLKMKEMIEDHRAAIPKARGLEKISAIQSLNAVHNLERISGQKVLVEGDCGVARISLAALMLEQGMKDKSITLPIPETLEAYNKVLVKVANSEEFKKLLPEEELTPQKCKELLTDQKLFKSISKQFTDNLQKAAVKEKNAQIQVNKALNNSQAEPVRNPAK